MTRLNPQNEWLDIPDRAVVGLVFAHEIAHATLGHGGKQVAIDEDRRQEEVNRAASEWGFREEIEAWVCVAKIIAANFADPDQLL